MTIPNKRLSLRNDWIYEAFDHMQEIDDREEVQMTIEKFYLLGYGIEIQYIVHEGGYVEWSIRPDENSKDSSVELLNVLLRIHYNDFIEAMCRENSHMSDYYSSMQPVDNQIIPF